MAFLKNLFGKKDAQPAVAEPLRRISSEPVQTKAEQTEIHDKMEAELAASRAAHDARKAPTTETPPET